MDKDKDPIRDEQFEAYLDGALASADDEAFRRPMRADEDFRATAGLQKRIDHTLRKLFPVVHPPASQIGNWPPAMGNPEVATKSRHAFRRFLAMGAAAVLAAIMVVWLSQYDDKSTPFFRPTPLAQIYVDTIRNGFRPYYECDDDERFASTFVRRQGRPLRLAPLPDDVQMLGLSYPGGLSRDTTAMLCTVGREPVMVFVDRETADTAQIATPEHQGTNVFRAERDGLVFYEVSHLGEPRVMEFLALAKPPLTRP
jgi:hypothetical protein